MKNRWSVAIGTLLLAACVSGPAACQTNTGIGVFESQTGVGLPAIQGEAVYDSEKQEYRVTGSGKNMWFDKDEFHFAWKRIKGDFIFTTQAKLLGAGVDPHRKLGWMVRSTLVTNSPHINAAVRGDGLTSLQFRRALGGVTEELKSALKGADVIQLERKGNRITMSVAHYGTPFITSSLDDIQLGEEVYVGLFVCSHNPKVLEQASFRNVRITVPASEKLVPYREYIGSRLETLNVDSGERRVLMETKDGIEAPNWTLDGSALIYNSRGRLFRFPLAEKTPVMINTGFADRCNNDHMLSPNGQTLAISHHTKEAGGKSLIYTLPVSGGEPKQVTVNGPSYLHGWSPDGKHLIYTGQRNEEFDIYRIPIEGGDETRLTSAKGLDDGSEYSPDGKWIYFNSARTGKMQLWRMKADGSDQEQLTYDEYNNWFPHVSRDGKRLVFISFDKEIAAEDHPFYKQVYLRTMLVDEKLPTIIAYVYGGQGTINVPSWSPDGRTVAFVSHTGL